MKNMSQLNVSESQHTTDIPAVTTDSDTSLTDETSQGQYIFQILVVTNGVVGTLANGFVLYVLSRSKQLKTRPINILFVNQMALDLFSSIWLVIAYSLKISQIYLSGPSGYHLCVFVVSETVVWYGLVGSSVNLAAIAVERYIMIVHPIWHKNNFKIWMIFAAIAFTWTLGILTNQILASTSTIVSDGQCLFGVNYASRLAKSFYGIWYFISYFCIVFMIFIYCYGRIAMAVRRQTKAFQVQSSANPSIKINELRALRIQTNAIKTAVIISVLFIVCWLPCDTYSLVAYTTDIDLTFVSELYYVTVFIAFFNVCLNPFIYAANYELIRKYWLRLTPCGTRVIEDSSVAAVALSAKVTLPYDELNHSETFVVQNKKTLTSVSMHNTDR